METNGSSLTKLAQQTGQMFFAGEQSQKICILAFVNPL
jgi:hypothetical protein